MKYPLLKDADLQGKRVLLRAGFDVPMENGKVMDASRIEALVPTMRHILTSGASLLLLSHQGRPDGKPDPEFSQKPLVEHLAKYLNTDVKFCSSCVGPEALKAAEALKPGEVLLLENLRFDPREKKNDPAFAKELAALGDLYVNDAFTNCHRAHASMVGLPSLLPGFIGLQLEEELKHLSPVMDDPKRPLTLVLGGAKMETKIPVLRQFLGKGDTILLGGAIANTFLAARGFDVAASKYEQEQVENAQELMLESEKPGYASIQVPRDAVVATDAVEQATKLDLPVENVVGDMRILDIGKVTIERYVASIKESKTIVWNGPVGYYELHTFSHATKRIAEAVKEATKAGAVSIVGGGDTIDFHTRYGYDLGAYTFVSTGGGAMLEFLSGNTLPALAALVRG